MKISIRLILFLIASITIVTFIVSKNEIRSEKRGLRADLSRRAEVLSESLQEIVEPALQRGSRDQLRRIVERFSNRERLAGVVVYNKNGEVLAESPNLERRFAPPPVPLARVQASTTGLSEFLNLNSEPMHAYYMPLHDGNSMTGVLAIFHDAGYIDTQSARMWRASFWHVIAEVLLIVLISVLIIRWTIVLPISRTAQWMKDVRRGRVMPAGPPGAKESFLAPFTSEVMNLTRSLADARSAAEEEARLRESGESIWTAERLRVSIRGKAQQGSLFVVSNREPYMHVFKGKAVETLVPASGFVTALEPILRACDGIWIASGSGNADRETVDVTIIFEYLPINLNTLCVEFGCRGKWSRVTTTDSRMKGSGPYAISRTPGRSFGLRTGKVIRLRTRNSQMQCSRKWKASSVRWCLSRIIISPCCRG